ncbi:hypothetical protein WHR41_00866 [Cladosporium halotolerans]|uniref:Phosphodiest-domain-containing protein n=1 Tax=Cladosporium halotolerans TaxID=1052096 RepID=A0AB34L2F8_9PEZI
MPPPAEYARVPRADDDDGGASASDRESEYDDGDFTGRAKRRSSLAESERERRFDRETLGGQEEVERLLSVAGGGGSGRRARRGLAGRMEQGGESERSSVSGEESPVRFEKQGKKAGKYGRFALVYAVIAGLFLALLYGAYNASEGSRFRTSSSGEKSEYVPQVLSNGTSLFAPTTLLISLDGFRADFLHRDLTPTLAAFIRAGVSPKYMLPSFPSVTFPNHFTLVTGLYPESHGVVGNTFWDPEMEREFYYTDPERSMQPEWWRAEPVWELAEREGVKSGVHMWPGSEAHIGDVEPTYVDKYNAKEELGRKVDRILGWLDMPGPKDESERAVAESPRPQLMAAYVPNVDADGHKYGPNSTEIRKTISEVDTMLGKLFAGIEARNLSDIVNVIIVSDHGMATTDTSRLIQLEDLLDTSLIEHTDGWPLYGLRPYDSSPENLERLYDDLLAKSQTPEYAGTFEVHLRDRTMPARYHFAHNARIAPLWLIPTTGWAIVTRDDFDVRTASGPYAPAGLHGYDHEHPLMRAIFVARGPAFPHAPGSEVDVFQNTEVYGLVCDSLGLGAAPNNGTLRLPLTPVGVHAVAGPGEVPEDPLPSGAKVPVIAPVPQFSSLPGVEVATGSEDKVSWTTDSRGSLVTVSPGDGTATSGEAEGKGTWTTDSRGSLVSVRPGQGADERPEVQDGGREGEGEDEDENLNHHNGWWAWFAAKFGDAKNWAEGIMHKGDGGGENERQG